MPSGSGRLQKPHRFASVKSTRSICISRISRPALFSSLPFTRHAFSHLVDPGRSFVKPIFRGNDFPAAEPPSRPPHSSGAPRNALMPAGAGSFQRLALRRLYRCCVTLTRNTGCETGTARLPRFSAAFGEPSPKPDLSPSRSTAQAALRDPSDAARPLFLADSISPLPDSAAAPMRPCSPPSRAR
jgi:hypothetical protein